MKLYEQILDKCTAEAIKSFLREVQERSQQAKSDINVSGSKDDLINYLKIAVSKKHASIEDVGKLLWDSEEVGKQHILLLTPDPESPNAATISDASAVAVALFGEIPVANIFPRYEYPSSGFAWADFRPYKGGWLAKAYGREIYRQSEGVVLTEELEDGVIREIRQYHWKEVKPTLVASWRPEAGILEIRIDISLLQNEKTIDERRDGLWTLLRPAFLQSDLLGLDIDTLLSSIINERKNGENPKQYSVSRVELMDPRSGLIRVIPSGTDTIDDHPGRTASLQTMLDSKFKPKLVRIEWKPNVDGCPKTMTEAVSVVIEKTSNGPELRILKRINQDTYEYIFNQLRSRLQ